MFSKLKYTLYQVSFRLFIAAIKFLKWSILWGTWNFVFKLFYWKERFWKIWKAKVLFCSTLLHFSGVKEACFQVAASNHELEHRELHSFELLIFDFIQKVVSLKVFIICDCITWFCWWSICNISFKVISNTIGSHSWVLVIEVKKNILF